MDRAPSTTRPRITPKVGEIRQRAEDDEQNYERVDEQTNGARPSSPGRATAIVHIDRDVEEEGHYEIVDARSDGARPSACHDSHYINTDGCRAPNYDQLAVQYHNTGDVQPYQQWSMADNGRDDQTYKDL